MNKYYIILPDGSSLFELPYSEDFIYHCLILLLDNEKLVGLRVLSFDGILIDIRSAAYIFGGTADRSAVFSLSVPGITEIH